MKNTIFHILWIFILFSACAQKTSQEENKLKWWQDSRFGMFIHWGPVTRYGGEISWTREKYGKEKYDSLYLHFNPEKFDAEMWVKTAQMAGMKYLVFTAKHYDGFCLWDTKTTNYNIMNTPFGRDVCKELAEAAHKADMPICWYYSPGDWKDDDCRNPITNHLYVERMLEQVRELLSNYGKISLLWIDYDGYPCPSHPKDIYNLAQELQPDIIINNRLEVFNIDESHSYIGNYGDYATPEQFVAGYGRVHWLIMPNLLLQVP